MVTAELEPQGDSALIKLTHAVFLDEPSRRQHEDAWRRVLAPARRARGRAIGDEHRKGLNLADPQRVPLGIVTDTPKQ